MRRMLTSRQIEILDSMTEEVFNSGVWEIDSGESDGYLNLKKLEIGYQYKIYLNASSSSNNVVLRFETEIGLSESYYNFIEDGKSLLFVLGDFGGAGELRMTVTKNKGVLENEINFDDAITEDVKFRYLITRHKLYI